MKPKLPVVDQNDKIICFKEKDDLSQEDIYRVSALWITNSKGEILLAKRHHTKTHDPEKWGPAVAGTVEQGETYKQNILKETEEEIGLKNIKPRKGPKIKTEGTYNYFCQWFILIIDKDSKDFNIQKSEVEEIRWFSKDKLLKEMNSSPDNFLSSMKEWIKIFTI